MAISGKKIILVGPEEVEKLSFITCLNLQANDNLNAKKDDLKEYKYPFLKNNKETPISVYNMPGKERSFKNALDVVNFNSSVCVLVHDSHKTKTYNKTMEYYNAIKNKGQKCKFILVQVDNLEKEINDPNPPEGERHNAFNLGYSLEKDKRFEANFIISINEDDSKMVLNKASEILLKEYGSFCECI